MWKEINCMDKSRPVSEVHGRTFGQKISILGLWSQRRFTNSTYVPAKREPLVAVAGDSLVLHGKLKQNRSLLALSVAQRTLWPFPEEIKR
ncbi:hypothetical protein PAAG_11731 [Paracoccidioides lutzii Pb01]|uniref:Uncharacterized protein n=1 Tax=Paracoccidioides lutzii (strain ATCC MYA-826 / Pb01) TaxID=502779 RepID=A0A0A2V1D3_PARBA|nr:hypothetical protein PAAG_11731 [Paracoccidioides lutzii Pb01]KGQ01601.1 hypothetical protein PAAG_11731 [Paracoccidioides lutzii Pb01]